MGRFKLVAVGDHAKQLNMCDGAPDLLLWQDRPIQLGRAVREGDGYRYPNSWNSLSSRHCNLQFQAAVDGSEVRGNNNSNRCKLAGLLTQTAFSQKSACIDM